MSADPDRAPRREPGHDPRSGPRHAADHEPRRDPRSTLGARGERLAAEHLERLGFTVLERNYRTRWGELDLIAFDGRTIAICEVKTRRAGGRAGTALEAVSRAKQAQVRRMAGRWLAERRDRPRAAQIRFDAIGITFDGAGHLVALEHLEGAF